MLGYIVLFLLLISLLLSIPAVQTQLAKYATTKINDDFNVNLVIKNVDLSLLGSIQLNGIEIRDVLTHIKFYTSAEMLARSCQAHTPHPGRL